MAFFNDKTVKVYKDNDYLKFTMDESFIVENGYEFKTSLKGWKLSLNFNNYYEKTRWLFNFKLPEISSIKALLETDNKEDIVFSFIDDWSFEVYGDDGQIKQRSEYYNFIENSYKYYSGWNIMEESIEDIYWSFKISTWYYYSWNIKYTTNLNWNVWVKTWYYENWGINYVENYKNWVLDWKFFEYDENWDIKEKWFYIDWEKSNGVG